MLSTKEAGFWATLALLVGAACALGGCSGIIYTRADPADGKTDPASPPNGGFAFNLRRSTVVLSAADQSAAAANPAPGAAKAATVNATKLDCKGQLTSACTYPVTATASPVSYTEKEKPTAYFAQPRSTNRYFGGTTLTPKTDPTDPLMIQSVGFSYSNQVSNIITAAGGGAATGVAFGPWGAVAGGVIGAVGAVVRPGPKPTWASAVCSPDLSAVQQQTYSDSEPTQELWLPIAMDYPTKDDEPDCWHPLPAAKAAGVPAHANSGWFYRIYSSDKPPLNASAVPPVIVTPPGGLTKLPNQFRTTADFFANTSAQNAFPVSACRAVEVELAWWRDIATPPAGQDLKSHRTSSGHLLVAVADPTIVQVLRVSNGSTVTLLPCGGFVSSGQPSTALSDDVTALVKQTQAIKTAQDQQKKSTK
jgi:hypothetical protein